MQEAGSSAGCSQRGVAHAHFAVRGSIQQQGRLGQGAEAGVCGRGTWTDSELARRCQSACEASSP
eukprot:15205509-Alexandrium_andersonii.AAC.1